MKKGKCKVLLNPKIGDFYKLKPNVKTQIIHVAGIAGEIDFSKITLAFIEEHDGLSNFLDKKKPKSQS